MDLEAAVVGQVDEHLRRAGIGQGGLRECDSNHAVVLLHRIVFQGWRFPKPLTGGQALIPNCTTKPGNGAEEAASVKKPFFTRL